MAYLWKNTCKIGAYKGKVETGRRGTHFISVISWQRSGHKDANLEIKTYTALKEARDGHKACVVEMKKMLEEKVD